MQLRASSPLTLIFNRAILFALIGLFAGAPVGLVNGIFAGVALGSLMELAEINILTPNNYFDMGTLMLGGAFGGGYGLATGAVTGAIAWAIAGSMQWRRNDALSILRHTMRGSLRTSLIVTPAGATSAAAMYAAWQYYRHAAPMTTMLHAAFAPFDGGFFYGSILGCAVGMTLGAILGARPGESWLNVPMRDLPSALKAQLLYFIGK